MPDGVSTAGQSQRAVFLSYASEDAAAAQQICTALRAADIEVWFDQSELRGGDAWDAAIRKHIKSCALFLPVISANTHNRIEGYFRLEWKLAIDRSYLIAADQAFLLPVVIDGTPQTDERIPDRFRELQWTRLPGGNTPPAFVEHVARLLSPAHQLPTIPTRWSMASTVPAAGKPPRSGAKASGSKFVLLVFALAVIAGGYIALDRLVVSKAKRDVGRSTAVTTASSVNAQNPIPEKSIAVLPFLDMSETKDQEYFSDGLSVELLDLLSKTEGLKVIARTSSFYFKGKQATIPEIASTLRVAHVLEGSVRKAGTTIRVTAQLIRASDGAYQWSETYDRDLKDVFKVQDEIAAAVVNALQLKLLPARLAGKSVMHNTDAYSLYLKGQYFARRASSADVDQGISYLQQAIAMEPDFAPAHAELASAYFFMGTFGSGPADAMIERCRAEVDRAQRLDPSLPVLHILRANLASVSYDWPTAEAEAEQALKLDPRNSDALYRRGVIERALGRPNEALELYRRALILDPLRVIDHIQLAMLLHSLGRLDETRAAAEAALAINPTAVKAHFLLGLVELSRSHLDAASAQMAQESGEWYRLEGQAMVAFAAKRWRDSDAALKRLIDVHQQIAAVQIAQLYAYRGERDKAFEWLDRAAQQRDPGLVFFQTDVLFASLRGDARFEALRRRLHVAT